MTPRKAACSAAAQKVLADLDAELAATATDNDVTLSWSTAERELLDILASAIDRRADIEAKYRATEDPKLAVKLSGELRQLDKVVMAVLSKISTDMPKPESSISRKARQAANVRWQRERERAANQ